MADKITSQSLREFELAVSLPKGARDKLELAIRDGIYQIRTFLKSAQVPSSKRTEVVEFACPSSWWQMFKYQHFPEWAKRIFPVRLNIVSRKIEWYESVRICPHLSDNPEGDHLEWLAGREKDQPK